jgi:alpha-tubulin suppressor-like RCC1 family protein/sugar lactone lactonase YvrE
MKNPLLSLVILASSTALSLAQPVITNQPLSQIVWAGTNVTFTVAVSGDGPYDYQWLFNSNNLPKDGIITTFAGGGAGGGIDGLGDGTAATNAIFNFPHGVALDAVGNLFIGDWNNNRVRRVDTNGIITVFAGGGAGGGTDGLGDGGAATNATLNGPVGVTFDAQGNLFIGDTRNNLVRKVDTNGIITLVAGGGTGGLGDGGAATNASLNVPNGVAFDPFGNLFIADTSNNRIRKVDTNGIITTVAGNGSGGYNGDGGAATNATLSGPQGVAVDGTGNVFIADYGNARVRKVATNGIITTVAGGGTGGLGDGGAATNASLNQPYDVAVDASGNLLVCDAGNNRIRKVGTNGIITTVAGGGAGGGTDGLGDGLSPTQASFNFPGHVVASASGTLYISDVFNQRIRKAEFSGSPILALNHVTTNNAGYYQVIVSDFSGSVTSDVAVLTVRTPPMIVVQPANQVVALAGTVTLGVTVNDPSAAYQWFKDGRLVSGATSNTLIIPNADIVNSGTYSVVVSNPGGIAISRPALVAVGNPTLISWGNHQYGQLGDGTTNSSNRPSTVASNTVAGAAGLGHSLFITTNGTLWAMGYNQFGQLGNGSSLNVSNPVSVANNIVAVAAGAYHSLLVTTNEILWAMGRNNSGQLGNGSTLNALSPVSVASNVVAVAAGAYHSLFIKDDGTLWAMGNNQFGQLGNGSTATSIRPVNVANNVVAVAAGANHSLFITADGTLWAMGNSQFGQLGDGATGISTTPIAVAYNVVAVAAGTNHSLFITAGGTLWTMGNNQFGQLGNGTTTEVHLPASVAGNVTAAAAGANHSLLVMTDGTLWAMGNNQFGQLGNGTTINTNVPVNVPHQTMANIFPAEGASFSLAIGRNQVPAAVTLNSLYQLYTGNPIYVQANTIPPGLAVNLNYSGWPIPPKNPGSYIVVGAIADLNYYGSATNVLVVGLPPQSLAEHLGVNRLQIQFAGTPNYPYILQMATNLTPPVSWQSIITNSPDANGNWSWTNFNLSAYPAGFYRAAAGP